MDEKKISVKLTGPAKVGGKWRKPGEAVSVSSTEAGHLLDAKAVDGNSLDDLAYTDEAFDRAVAAKAELLAATVTDAVIEEAIKDRLAEIQAAADKRVAEVEKDATAKIEEIRDELAGANVRAEAAEAKVAEHDAVLTAANQCIAVLEAQIAATPKPAAKKT